MDKSQILEIRRELQEFLNSDEMIFEFEVKTSLEKRNSLPYKIIFPGIKLPIFYFRHFISRIATFIDYSPIKVMLYKLIGMKIKKGAFIAPDVVIDAHFPKLVEIGEYAVLGWGSKVFVHDFDGKIFRIGRVKVGRGAVLGGFSFVRAGVEVGEEALVKLTSTAYKDIPDFGRNETQFKNQIIDKEK